MKVNIKFLTDFSFFCCLCVVSLQVVSSSLIDGLFLKPMYGTFLYLWAFVASLSASYYLYKYYHESIVCPYTWHGGSPKSSKFSGGSCWCGKDGYCLCTPSLAIEVILELKVSNEITVALIKRRDPPVGFAIPGGFVNVGETVEDTAVREIKEETSLNLDIKRLEQFHFYSNPSRDTRRATASAIFRYVLTPGDEFKFKSGDDAKDLVLVKLADTVKIPLQFDHQQVLTDYIRKYHPHLAASAK